MGVMDREKQHAHELIDQLPSHQLSAVVGLLEAIIDPVARSLDLAPPDDEPYTERQRARDAEAEASIIRGEGIEHDEILREFGM